jgi:hypothetical protein
MKQGVYRGACRRVKTGRQAGMKHALRVWVEGNRLGQVSSGGSIEAGPTAHVPVAAPHQEGRQAGRRGWVGG